VDRINTALIRLQNRREDGQAMVEYGLILGLVSVVGIAALALIGGDLTKAFTAVTDALGKVYP
jgi:pilus assembly protein Flp/PilA